jgi:hypothetical protein
MLGAVKSQWFNNLPRNGRTSDDADQEDELDIRLFHKQHSGKRLSAILSLAAFVLFIVLSLFNVAVIIRRLTTARRYESPEVEFVELSQRPDRHHETHGISTEDWGSKDCGSTVETAIARGCPFDVVSNLWTPRRCYDASFALEALHGAELGTEHGGIGAPEFGLGDWEWYEDAELSRRIHNVQDLINFLAKRDKEGLGLEAYTHMSFHAAHCSYLARVATRGLDRLTRGEHDVWIPEVAADPTHARHCEHVFGELYRLGENGSRRNWTEVGFGIAPCVRIG